jgi:hypothetical protein
MFSLVGMVSERELWTGGGLGRCWIVVVIGGLEDGVPGVSGIFTSSWLETSRLVNPLKLL